MPTCFQNIIFPSLNTCTEEHLYLRTDHKADYSYSHKRIEFQKGGKAFTDTYFNSLSLNAWKKLTRIKDAILCLSGCGNFRIRVGLHKLGSPHTWLSEQDICLSDGNVTKLNIPWHASPNGMLYIYFKCLDVGYINSGWFETTCLPQQDTKLGIIITHFNRKNYVIPAISRISHEILDDQFYKDKIDLFVIDNSQNIEPHEAKKAFLIKNKNLGGSGGFTRGLIELKNRKNYTHCLFMDDDASCEIESIKRTFSLLAFRKEDNLAIAGSLLKEDEPWFMYEKGIQYINNEFLPICHGLDMRQVSSVIHAENEVCKISYGAWWFFAFPINQVEHYPFPFFVRGDDMLFGLLNSFDIATMNGIACWGEDFRLKESPITRYLSVRSNIVIRMLASDMTARQIIFFIWKTWLKPCIFSRNYESAEMIILAIKHVLQGPIFWKNNIDMSLIRNMFSDKIVIEKSRPLNLNDLNILYKNNHEKFIRKLFRIFSLNTILLPSFLRKNETVFEEKGFYADTRRIFAARNVLYYDNTTRTGYTSEINSRRTFSILKDFFIFLPFYFLNFNRIKKLYKKEIDQLTSEKFWRSIFK